MQVGSRIRITKGDICEGVVNKRRRSVQKQSWPTIEGISQRAGPEDSTIVVGRELGKNTHEGMERQRRDFQEVTLFRRRSIQIQQARRTKLEHTSGDLMRCKSDFSSRSEMRPCWSVEMTCSLLNPAKEGRAPSKLPCHEGKSYTRHTSETLSSIPSLPTYCSHQFLLIASGHSHSSSPLAATEYGVL